MFKPLSVLKAKRNLSVLFLASHGLRSHLSAIRWACSRLRKTIGAPLTREQRHLINEAYLHTLTLTCAMNAMLLVGRIEEGEHPPRLERLDLHEFLRSAQERAKERSVQWSMTIPDACFLLGDRVIVQSIFDVLSVLSAEAATSRQVFVDTTCREATVEVALHAAWELPLLNAARSPLADSNQLLGGTTGLMLSLGQELVRSIGGSLELQEVATGEEMLISDGTVEMSEAAEDYRVVVTFRPA